MQLKRKNRGKLYHRSVTSMVMLLGAHCAALHATEVAGEPGLRPVPTTWRATYETWKLADNERMGMLGANLFFDVHENVKLGIGSYGALVGERGGFITLGLAGELQTYIAPSWRLHSGVFLGGGGGRDASSQVGGGFMFRGDLGITYETGRYGNIGLGVSYVTFPTGDIRSTQPYILYEFPFETLLASGWDTGASNPMAGRLGTASPRRQEFSVVALSYQIPNSVSKADGSPQGSSMQLLGAEWTTYLDSNWFLRVESAGAMGGQNSGYMQILGGGGYRFPLTSSTDLKLWATTGPGGGGNVDTGGGFLVAGGVSLAQYLTKSTALEFSVGAIDAPQASFRALLLGLKLTHKFGIPDSSEGSAKGALAGYEPQHLRFRAVNQTYLKGSNNWRSRDTDMSVNNMGVQADYFVSPNWYLTGQGLAAYSGNAGAYMAGLVGAGGRLELSESWFLEAEALIGAAGGGSLNVGSGLVAQYNIGLGYQLTPALSVMLTGGQIASPNGDFRANVVGASLGYRFTGFTKAVD
jgi:hypothetical protein